MTRNPLLLALGLLLASTAAAGAPPAVVEGRDAAGWAALFEDKKEAFAARERLGAAGPTAVPIAAELLGHPSPVVRGWATWVVAMLAQDATDLRTTVLRLLEDPEASVREEAIGAVGAMLDTLGTAPLEPARKILREDGMTAQGRAADVLRSLGERAVVAIPDLVACLERGEKYAADNCARALLSMGEAGAAALARAWPGLSEERGKQAKDGIEEDAFAAGPTLARLLASREAGIAEGAEGVASAAGWRLLPALDAAARAGPTEVEAARIARVRAKIVADLPAAYARPGEHDALALDAPLAIDPKTLDLRWETGSGHGNSLVLWRTRRTDAGLLVRSLAFSGPSLGNRRAPERVSIFERGPVPAPRLAAACEVLARVRAVRLVDRPQTPGEHGGRAWSSSADFHARVRLASGTRAVFEESFTGYAGSSSHRTSCRVEAATAVLRELLSGIEASECKPDADDLDVLEARCATVGADEWWVKERVLRMVAGIGDSRFEPMLRAHIEAPPEEHPWEHMAAIDAYARITGVDLRPDPFGREQVPGVRAKYLEHFRAHPPQPK